MWRLSGFEPARQKQPELVASGHGPHMSRARLPDGGKSLDGKRARSPRRNPAQSHLASHTQASNDLDDPVNNPANNTAMSAE